MDPLLLLALSGWFIAGTWSLIVGGYIGPRRARALLLRELAHAGESADAVRRTLIAPEVESIRKDLDVRLSKIGDEMFERLRSSGFAGLAARSRQDREAMAAVDEAVRGQTAAWLEGPLAAVEMFAPETGEKLRAIAEKSPEAAARGVLKLLKIAESQGLVKLEAPNA